MPCLAKSSSGVTSINYYEVRSKVLPWSFRLWCWLQWLSWFLTLMFLTIVVCFNELFNVFVDAMLVDTLSCPVLACSKVSGAYHIGTYRYLSHISQKIPSVMHTQEMLDSHKTPCRQEVEQTIGQ